MTHPLYGVVNIIANPCTSFIRDKLSEKRFLHAKVAAGKIVSANPVFIC